MGWVRGGRGSLASNRRREPVAGVGRYSYRLGRRGGGNWGGGGGGMGLGGTIEGRESPIAIIPASLPPAYGHVHHFLEKTVGVERTVLPA